MTELKKKILIIDDEPDTLAYFSSLLQDNGYDTIESADGEAGLRLIQDELPDLITLDISMPEKSGVRLYTDIKTNENWKHIPVIIITGVSEDFKKFISTRSQIPAPEGYMSKPINPEEFLRTTAELLGRI
ncbi:response regulator [bacterium]|nr:response regulator [bacterium]